MRSCSLICEPGTQHSRLLSTLSGCEENQHPFMLRVVAAVCRPATSLKFCTAGWRFPTMEAACWV